MTHQGAALIQYVNEFSVHSSGQHWGKVLRL